MFSCVSLWQHKVPDSALDFIHRYRVNRLELFHQEASSHSHPRYLCVCLCLSVCLSIWLWVYNEDGLCLTVCLWPSVCLYVCLSVSRYTTKMAYGCGCLPSQSVNSVDLWTDSPRAGLCSIINTSPRLYWSRWMIELRPVTITEIWWLTGSRHRLHLPHSISVPQRLLEMVCNMLLALYF